MPAATAGRWGLASRDGALAVLVLGLGFLLASFPAHNSDLWLHLATGRALALGETALGTDPFSHASEGRRWVNPSWLFDVSAYGLYTRLGGGALVLAKALLVVLLGAIMLHAGWRGPARVATCLATAATLVALGPDLELRPTVLSYLFLAVTLWWLVRGRGATGEALDPAPTARVVASHVPLLLAFALWANVDEWFLAGPVVLLLFCLGRALELRKDRQGRSADLRGLGLVTAVGVLMPLLNPHHVHVLGWAEAWGGGRIGGAWDRVTGRDLAALAEITPARVAYATLLVVSALALFLNRRRPAWSLVFVWGTALLVGVFLDGGGPFFAVVAGVVAGVQLQAWAEGRAATGTGRAGASQPGLLRWGIPVLMLTAALIASWPGWLQDQGAQPRAWAVEMDPSLELAGRQLARWQDEGRLPAAARGFHLSTDAAQVLLWVAPRQQTFYDGRPGLFPAAVRDDFVTVRGALVETTADEARPDWRSVLRARGITHLIVHDAHDRGLANAVRILFGAPDEWRLVHVGGRTLVFAWADRWPAGGDVGPSVDLRQRAFHPSDDERAPAHGLRAAVEPRTWADAFVTPSGHGGFHRDEALVHLILFEARRPAFLEASRRLWEAGAVAGLVGLHATDTPAVAHAPGGALRAAWLKVSREPISEPSAASARTLDLAAYAALSAYLSGRDDGPPESLFLAVRAARRAVTADPTDPVAHLLLGRAYLRLVYTTRERAALGSAPALAKVRTLQAAAALKHAARLGSNLAQAHESLARLFSGAGEWEFALEHVREALKGNRIAGPAAGESGEDFAGRLRRLEADEAELARRVSDLAILVKARALNAGVVREAQVGHELGLSARALVLLRGADAATLGREGVVLRLQLGLLAGELDEVREWSSPEHEATLGVSNHRWLRAQLAAAAGDYADADAALSALAVDGVEVPELKLRNARVGTVVALLVGKSALEGAAPQRLPFSADPSAVSQELATLVTTFRHQSDLATLRGALAVEWGDPDRATRAFRHSLSQWQSDADGPTFLARRYLDLLGAPARE